MRDNIENYIDQLFLLILAESYHILFSALFGTFLAMYSADSLKYYTYCSTTAYLVYIIAGAYYSSIYGLNGMLVVFISCSLINTSMKVILFLNFFQKFRQSANFKYIKE